ncbi:RUN and FYVE domain-containing protein 2 [Balamuthia mandrillaris]
MQEPTELKPPHSTVTAASAVVQMQKGATLLKCGHRGNPHFRTFVLSEDMKTLSWTSPKKPSAKSTVSLADVTELKLGQKTKIFKSNYRPEYERLAFSLVYGGGKTLDIVCKNKTEFEVWVMGLKSLTVEPIDLREAKATPVHEGSAQVEETVTVVFKGKKTIVKRREDSNDVYSFGQGVNGRLGHGDEYDQSLPKVIETLLGRDIRGVSCGQAHTVAWNAEGEAFSWGAGSNGRLGHGHERDRFTPLFIEGLSGRHVIQVACGENHSVALTASGQVYAWGMGADGRLGFGDEETVLTPFEVNALEGLQVVYVACGRATTAAVTSEGHLYMWGRNENGALGIEDTAVQLTPVRIDVDGQKVSRVQCAATYTAAITERGQVYTWGDGTNGVLGHGDESDVLKPTKVRALEGVTIVRIATGGSHMIALGTGGKIYTWGEGSRGQLGKGKSVQQSSAPLLVDAPFQDLAGDEVIQIAAGAASSVALTKDGLLFSWGHGANGRLGHGHESDIYVPTVVEAMSRKKVREIACGGSHCTAMILHGWVPDEESEQCMACKTAFTVIRRRHHCRNCGGIFCGSCSNKKYALLKAGFTGTVRVCDKCYTSLSSSN